MTGALGLRTVDYTDGARQLRATQQIFHFFTAQIKKKSSRLHLYHILRRYLSD